MMMMMMVILSDINWDLPILSLTWFSDFCPENGSFVGSVVDSGVGLHLKEHKNATTIAEMYIPVELCPRRVKSAIFLSSIFNDPFPAAEAAKNHTHSFL